MEGIICGSKDAQWRISSMQMRYGLSRDIPMVAGITPESAKPGLRRISTRLLQASWSAGRRKPAPEVAPVPGCPDRRICFPNLFFSALPFAAICPGGSVGAVLTPLYVHRPATSGPAQPPLAVPVPNARSSSLKISFSGPAFQPGSPWLPAWIQGDLLRQ